MTAEARPNIVVLAGPNGAGKTTASERLLRDTFAVTEFVNADRIAHGLSAFDPDRVARAAGRLMLKRLDELAASRISFAFETTLASKTFAPWLSKRIDEGFALRLIYLWLPDAEMAVERVRVRVRAGGHDVPADTIRRRYTRSLRNWFALYVPIASSLEMHDGSSQALRLIAAGGANRPVDVLDSIKWRRANVSAHDPESQA